LDGRRPDGVQQRPTVIPEWQAIKNAERVAQLYQFRAEAVDLGPTHASRVAAIDRQLAELGAQPQDAA
jgi:hypothetical protein